MDRHLFRGRRVDNGKLITGGVIFDSGLEIDFSRNPISKDFKNCYIAENCDEYLHEHSDFCPDCGQRIDWN